MNLHKNLSSTQRVSLLNRGFLFLLFTGIAILVALADRAPLDLESISHEINISQKFVYYWQGVVYGFFPGPYVYRVLIPYLYWLLNQTTHLSLITIDLYIKVILLTACQYGLLKYLTCFFEKTAALLGVFIFNALMGYFLSFIKGPSIIETIDILNFLIMTLGLIAIHEKKLLYLSIVLFIGLLNRETPVILLPILFIHEWLQSKRFNHSLYILFISLATFVSIRILVTSWAGSMWFNLGELQSNLPFFFGVQSREAAIGNFQLVVLLGPFVLLGLYRFNEHPQFLKIAASVVPIIIVIHYIVARIIESRLWIPLFPLLIPLTVNNLIKLNSPLVDQFKQD